jgi:hypothetical protein
MSVHDGRQLERDRHKLLQLCERAYSICMGDCEPSDMDDWVTDYNETKREISWENVKEHATPLAGAGVETGVEVHTTGDVADKAASGGCCASACCASLVLCEGEENTEQFNRLNEHRQEAVAVAGLHQSGQQHPPESEQ